VIATLGGDAGREFFMRSAAKPFQAAVVQRSGAALGDEQLAMASASHGAQPLHVSMVREMLASVGLDEQHLLCPPDRPSSATADRLWARWATWSRSECFTTAGEHASMLRACGSRLAARVHGFVTRCGGRSGFVARSLHDGRPDWRMAVG
jgi:L-asparaginase II